MNLWKKDGKLIVNEDHQPILCDECPCGNEYIIFDYGCEVYFPRVYGTQNHVFGEYSGQFRIKIWAKKNEFMSHIQQYIGKPSWDRIAIPLYSMYTSGFLSKTYESQFINQQIDHNCDYTGKEIGYYSEYINGLNPIDIQYCSAYKNTYPGTSPSSLRWVYTFQQDPCKNGVISSPADMYMAPLNDLSGWRFLVPTSMQLYMSRWVSYDPLYIMHGVVNRFFQRSKYNYNDRPYIEIRGDTYNPIQNFGIPVYGSSSTITEESARNYWNYLIQRYRDMQEYWKDDPEWVDPLYFTLTGLDYPSAEANCNILSSNFDQVFPFYDENDNLAVPLGRRDAYLNCTSGIFKSNSGSEMFISQGISTSHVWYNIYLGN